MQYKITTLKRQLAIFTLTRWLDSTAYRMVYPFLPVFARGLGISIEQITIAISIRSALGLIGPVLGFLSDLRGRRNALLYGLFCFSIGVGVIAIWPTYLSFFGGLLLSTIGGIIIEATIHAYLGDQIPYKRRSRAIAIVELGWSGSYVLGIPILGWIIARGNWSSPFIWLAYAGLVCIVLVLRIMPPDPSSTRERSSIVQGMGTVFKQPKAISALVFAFLVVTANQFITIVYGVWMEDAFHLQVTELGLVSSIIGVAEILGTILVVSFTDRLGIQRAIILGLLINSIACFTISCFLNNIYVVLPALFFFYLSFEFSITSSIPLMTELVPAARATFLATNITAYALADSIGAFIGSRLYQNSLAFNVLFAIIFNALGLGLLLFIFHHTKHT